MSYRRPVEAVEDYTNAFLATLWVFLFMSFWVIAAALGYICLVKMDSLTVNDGGERISNTTQVVTIESANEATELSIDGNGTNLFAALNIPEGRVDPKEFTGGISRRRSYQIARTVEALVAGQ